MLTSVWVYVLASLQFVVSIPSSVLLWCLLFEHPPEISSCPARRYSSRHEASEGSRAICWNEIIDTSPVGTWPAPPSFDNAWNACRYSSPGATTTERVRGDAGAVESTAKEMEVIEGVLRGFEVIGDRYHPVSMTMLNGKGERKPYLFTKDRRYWRLSHKVPLLLAQSIKGDVQITRTS